MPQQSGTAISTSDAFNGFQANSTMSLHPDLPASSHLNMDSAASGRHGNIDPRQESRQQHQDLNQISESDHQFRTRTLSFASEMSSAHDSLLENHGEFNNRDDDDLSHRHGDNSFDTNPGDDVASVLSSPALVSVDADYLNKARLCPSTSDQGFICEIFDPSTQQGTLWPVRWTQMLRLLLEPETTAGLPAGHIVRDLSQIVSARIQADELLRNELGVFDGLQDYSLLPTSTHPEQTFPEPPTVPPTNEPRPYGNPEATISDLSVASYPRYKPSNHQQDDTRSLTNFRLREDATIGYSAHRQRRGATVSSISDMQKGFSVGVDSNGSVGLAGSSTLDDMTPTTNTFHRAMVYMPQNPQPQRTFESPMTIQDQVVTSHAHEQQEQNSVEPREALTARDRARLISNEGTSFVNGDDSTISSAVAAAAMVVSLAGVNHGRRPMKRLNPTTEHYYWDSDHQHLYPAGPGGTFVGRGELLTFPPQSYFQVFKDQNAPPLVPSDPLPRANEWLRAQVCVQDCQQFKMSGKRPAVLRQHFAACKYRDMLEVDPLGRLCVLQIAASRQVKREAHDVSAAADKAEARQRTASRAGSVRSHASAFDDDEDEEFVAGGSRPPRARARTSVSMRGRSTSVASQTSIDGEMMIDGFSTSWPASTSAWAPDEPLPSSLGPPAMIRHGASSSLATSQFVEPRASSSGSRREVQANHDARSSASQPARVEPASFLSMEE
ncbi:hypothetical protein OIO90_003156 [Microbotryomycetes sp. JL221]|nr:hypothetical protein OIO90_003156 [Microbotryomycetes sp. JL221]